MRIILIFFISVLTKNAQAQFGEPGHHMATDGKGFHLFNINPAALPAKNQKAGIAIGQNTESNNFESRSNANGTTKQTSEKKQSFTAISILGDLGAGAAAGLLFSKWISSVQSTSTAANMTPEETMTIQTAAARFVIELTQSFRVALNMRYIFEDADIVGTFTGNNRDRVTYKGTLVGYTSGMHYTYDKLYAGLAYYPPLRGKAEILAEEKIIAEPGLTSVQFAYDVDKAVFGATYTHWLYQRDERARDIRSEDGNRNISANGVDFDRFLFPQSAIEVGLDYKITEKAALRFHVAQQNDVFVFDPEQVPDDRDGQGAVKYNKIKVALKLSSSQVQLLGGLSIFSRSTSLGADAGRVGDYSASGKEIFIVGNVDF